MKKNSGKAGPCKTPAVPKDAKSDNKYSTGEKGRSAPTGLDKKHKSRTNP